MRRISFDWRWVAILAVLIIATGANRLPWPIVALTLGAGGGYLLWYGWGIWAGRSQRSSSGRRVVYWRGQRIEMNEARPARRLNLPPLREIGPAAIYLLIGGVLSLASLSIVIERIGL
ncbi:MAG: hypothetical protein Fur005_37860 [Roseiflexaceae bacterium]